MQLVIAMPVFEDWESAALLCEVIDKQVLSIPDLACSVLLIDDGSREPVGDRFDDFKPRNIESLAILTLRRNLGHQRAIAVGLSYIQQNLPYEAVMVMDADGEDRPEDIPLLLAEFDKNGRALAVFAERGRRIESLKFKFFYLCYRVLHYLMTGKGIKVGNFSVLPRRLLNNLVSYQELWNHYAAAVLNSRLPYTTVRADRGNRLRGQSQMNFVNLVVHGLSALFAYQELVSTRILIAACSSAAAILLFTFVLIGVRLFTAVSIPGWTTLAIGLLVVLIAQLLTTSLAVIVTVMMNRSSLGFLPLRDYAYFVEKYNVFFGAID